MTPEEAVDLLILARQFDNRIGAVDIIRGAEWADVLYEVSLASAKIALKDFYRDSTDKTILPGNIRERAKKIRTDHQAAIERSVRTVDYQTATERDLPLPATLMAPSVRPPQRSQSTRERETEKAEAIQRAREERAARSPEAAAAWEFMKSRVNQSPVGKRPWWEVHAEDSRIQRDRRGKGDPESLGRMLRVVSGEIKRASEEAA